MNCLPSLHLALATLLVCVGASAKASEARTVTISAVGDIMMGTNFPNDTLRADRGQDLFKFTSSYFKASDIGFGNLEGPLFDGEADGSGKQSGTNRYVFRTPTEYGRWLSEAGVSVVSLANNHAMDFGAAGFTSTKQTLQHFGIKYASKNRGDVAVFAVNGLSVAVLAVDFYPGAHSLTTPASTYAEIKALRQQHDIVIVSAHSGGEGPAAERLQPGHEVFLGEDRGDAIQFAHQAIDAGAGLILMHGPHVVRAMEVYSEHLIVYSLGNFITERGISISGDQGLAPMVRVKLDDQGRFVTGSITSFRQTREFGTIYDPSGAVLQRIVNLSKLDFPQSMPQFDLQSGRFSPAP